MDEARLPTEDFLRICTSMVEHGEEEFPLEWQIVVVDSNHVGSLARYTGSGLRAESGSSLQENSVGPAHEVMEEPSEKENEGGIFVSAESHDSYCRDKNCSSQKQNSDCYECREVSTPKMGSSTEPLQANNSPPVRLGAGSTRSRRVCLIEGRPRKEKRNDVRRVQAGKNGKSGDSSMPPTEKKVQKKLKRSLKLRAAKKRRKSTCKEGIGRELS